MDTNINYTQYNGNIPTGNLSYGQAADFAKQLGMDQASRNFNFISNGNIYRLADNGQGGGGVISQIDTVANRQQAQAKMDYQAQAGSAVAGLQQGKQDLAGQYADLLKTVKGEYDPLINQTTASAGAEEARRGISPDSMLFQQQTQGALQPIYGAEAANAQAIGQGSISDSNAYTNAIAQAKLGIAGTNTQLPLQYGQLALQQQALPSTIQLALAQAANYNAQAKAAPYIPVNPGGLVFNSSGGNYASPIQSILSSLGINLKQ